VAQLFFSRFSSFFSERESRSDFIASTHPPRIFNPSGLRKKKEKRLDATEREGLERLSWPRLLDRRLSDGSVMLEGCTIFLRFQNKSSNTGPTSDFRAVLAVSSRAKHRPEQQAPW
jgi:hypothetical protein